MATVRIYKVAELLNTTSQEVTALLKRDHGHRREERVEHDRRSRRASVRRVVSRRSAAFTLPGGDIFAETPVVEGQEGRPAAKKAAEPVKPAAPSLPPPRLVKTAKPAASVAPPPEPVAVVPEPPEVGAHRSTSPWRSRRLLR